jgi:hypothetical protein
MDSGSISLSLHSLIHSQVPLSGSHRGSKTVFVLEGLQPEGRQPTPHLGARPLFPQWKRSKETSQEHWTGSHLWQSACISEPWFHIPSIR